MKEDNIRLINSQCHLGYWLGPRPEFDRFDLMGFPHLDRWIACLNLLTKIGFKVTADPEVKKRYKSISQYHKYGIWKGLEVKMDIYPAGFKFEFYQNIKQGEREPGKGEYEFQKIKIMPYLIKKRYELTTKKICQLLGCKIDLGDSSPLAEMAIIQNKQSSCHNVTPVNSLTDFQAQMKSYDLNCNNNDRDGKKIECGQVKYFRHWNGRIYRGKAYHNLNNSWYVLLNKYSWTCQSSGSLFDATPKDLSARRIKAGEIPPAKAKEMEFLKSLSPGKLKFLLQKKSKQPTF